jgi:hypothetical protein
MAFDGINDSLVEASKQYGFYWGKVTNNSDPEKLGRVKVDVPGVFNVESSWAFPCGMPGAGTSTMGSYIIPRVDASVLVGFIQGDLEEPFYFSGPSPVTAAGASGAPRRPVLESAKEAPNVRVLAQTENFEVYIRDTTDAKELCLRGLADSACFMTVDLIDGSIHISAERYLKIEAPMIAINASGQLQLNGRVVNAVGSKI